jgi:hypothetical protein
MFCLKWSSHHINGKAFITILLWEVHSRQKKSTIVCKYHDDHMYIKLHVEVTFPAWNGLEAIFPALNAAAVIEINKICTCMLHSTTTRWLLHEVLYTYDHRDIYILSLIFFGENGLLRAKSWWRLCRCVNTCWTSSQ